MRCITAVLLLALSSAVLAQTSPAIDSADLADRRQAFCNAVVQNNIDDCAFISDVRLQSEAPWTILDSGRLRSADNLTAEGAESCLEIDLRISGGRLLITQMGIAAGAGDAGVFSIDGVEKTRISGQARNVEHRQIIISQSSGADTTLKWCYVRGANSRTRKNSAWIELFTIGVPGVLSLSHADSPTLTQTVFAAVSRDARTPFRLNFSGLDTFDRILSLSDSLPDEQWPIEIRVEVVGGALGFSDVDQSATQLTLANYKNSADFSRNVAHGFDLALDWPLDGQQTRRIVLVTRGGWRSNELRLDARLDVEAHRRVFCEQVVPAADAASCDWIRDISFSGVSRWYIGEIYESVAPPRTPGLLESGQLRLRSGYLNDPPGGSSCMRLEIDLPAAARMRSSMERTSIDEGRGDFTYIVNGDTRYSRTSRDRSAVISIEMPAGVSTLSWCSSRASNSNFLIPNLSIGWLLEWRLESTDTSVRHFDLQVAQVGADRVTVHLRALDALNFRRAATVSLRAELQGAVFINDAGADIGAATQSTLTVTTVGSTSSLRVRYTGGSATLLLRAVSGAATAVVTVALRSQGLPRLTALFLDDETTPTRQFNLKRRDVMWTLRGIDQYGDAFPIAAVALSTSITADPRVSVNVDLSRADAADGLSSALTLGFSTSVVGDDITVRLRAALGDIEAVATMDFLAPPAVVGFLQTIYSVREDRGPQTICAAMLSGMLSGFPDAPNPQIIFDVDDGASTAMRDDDFSLTPQTWRYSRGVIENCSQITIVDDDIPEADETMLVTITGGWSPPSPRGRSLRLAPYQAVVTILDDDKIRVRMETGRMVGGAFTAADEAVEELFSAGGVASPLLLRISFWTDEGTPAAFSDNLGGERRIVFDVAATTDTASLPAGACPTTLTELVAGADACLRAAADGGAARVSGRDSAAANYGAEMHVEYARNGRHELFVEIRARHDGVDEGEERFTINAAGVRVQMPDGTADDAYIADPDAAALVARVDEPDRRAELSLRVENNDDVRLDTAANLGEANAVKVADVVISDGGGDSLSGRITGVDVSGADASGAADDMRFVLTEDGSAAPLNFPLRVPDGGEARFDLYAFLAEDDATDITDGATITVTLDVQAAGDSDRGFHSLAAAEVATALVAYEVVGAELSTDFVRNLTERDGEHHWDIRGVADTDDLRERLALRDAHGNFDLDDYAAADNFQFALVADDSDAGVARKTIPLFGEGRYIRVATQTNHVASAAYWRMSISLADINEEIKTIKDGTRLQLVVWHAQLPSVERLEPKFTLNYIADAAGLVGAASHAPDPISSERTLTLNDVRIRAYNAWSGQSDLDATLAGADDFAAAIREGMSCALPLRAGSGFNRNCEAREIENAVIADADGDGVWTFAAAPSFRPAFTSVGAALSGATGTLDLVLELDWRIADLPAANFNSSATVISAAAYEAYDPIVIGFLQTEYGRYDSQDESLGSWTLCGALLSGMMAPQRPDVIATVTLEAGDAEAGADYGDVVLSEELRWNRARIENCFQVPIVDDGILENDEIFFVNLNLAWEAPNEGPLSANPGRASVTIKNNDRARLRIETGRIDDNDDFIASDQASEAADGGDPLLLRISFWTDEDTSQPFHDNLGGQRRLRFAANSPDDSARLAAAACPATLTDLVDGADACFGMAGDSGLDGIAAAAPTAGFAVSMSATYTRGGRQALFVAMPARLDNIIEGEETFTIDAAAVVVETLDGVADADYVIEPNAATLTVRVADGETPEVRYFDAAAERVAEFNVVEGVADMSAYRVGLHDQNSGAALGLKAPFAFSLVIGGEALAAVVFVDDGDSGDGTAVGDGGKRMTFTFPAGDAVQLAFEIDAPTDDNPAAERGTLNYARQSGAANVAHPPSLALQVVETFSRRLPARLRLRAETPTLVQQTAFEEVTARFSLVVIDNHGADDVLSPTVTLTAVADGVAEIDHPEMFKVEPGGGEVAVALAPGADTTLTLTASLEGVDSASAVVRIRAAGREPRRLALRAERSTLTQTTARGDVAARFTLFVLDNYGDPIAADAAVTFQLRVAPADAATAPTPAALTAVAAQGRVIEVNLSVPGADDFELRLSANSASLGDAHASVSVLTAPRRLAELELTASATLTAAAPLEVLELQARLRAYDNYGDPIAAAAATLDAALVGAAEFIGDLGVSLGDMTRQTVDIGADGATRLLRLRLNSAASATLTLSLSADGAPRREQRVDLVSAPGRLRTLSVAGPEEATQAVYGEPLIVSFEVAATDDYGEPIAVDVALSLEVVGTLLATADLHGDAALTPRAFNLAGGRGTVMVRVNPRGRSFQLRLLAASGDIDARDEVRIVGAISSDLRLALAGPAKVVLGDGGRGDFVLELSALDANGDYVEADNVSLTITQTDGVVSALSPATLSLGAMQPARVAVSISAAPLGDADWTLRAGHATLIDADLTVRLLRGPELLDVNKDSDLELGELILIQRHLLDPDAGARNLSRNMRRADANGMEALLNNLRQLRMDRALDFNDDGEGDIEDMRLLIRYAFGLESTLPPEFDVDKARALLRGE